MSVVFADDWLTVHHGDARAVLPTLPAASVDAVVTSPPYWGLRDYGVAGQIGLESTPDAYVAELVAIFREVRRVLRPDGTVWLNLGDSYSSGPAAAEGRVAHRGIRQVGDRKNPSAGIPLIGPNRMPLPGLKPKDRVMIPARVALALQADGWWLRDEIVWHKPNPMPSSVQDRTTPAHEMVYLLTKSARYWYDSAAIAETTRGPDNERNRFGARLDLGYPGSPDRRRNGARSYATPNGPTLSPHGQGFTRRSKQAAAAAATPSGSASSRTMAGLNDRWDASEDAGTAPLTRNRRSVWMVATQAYAGAHFATFPEALIEPMILAGCRPGGVVLDPFAGSGTVALVAQRLSRRSVLIELNGDYLLQALGRTRQVPIGLQSVPA